MLSDLIGDLTWSPNPVEIKVFSTDTRLLKIKAAEIARAIEKIPGVVDVNDGLVVAGPTMRLKTNMAKAARTSLTPRALGKEIQATMIGTVSSYLLRGDRIYPVRVQAAGPSHARQQELATMPLRTLTGANLTVRDVANIEHEPGILEMHREDLRQLVAVSARFENVDMGHGIAAIQARLAKTVKLPPDARIEFGGLYQQQQESFRNLAYVLFAALVLVYVVLMLEFRTFLEPLAIWLGALLARHGQFFDRAVPLATVMDLSEVFVQLRIPSRDFGKVRQGTPVEIRLTSLPGHIFHGQVTRISGQADPLTGNVVVFALIQNEDRLLRPGLSCQARVWLPEVPDVLAVPLAAVADHSGTPVVTVIRAGQAHEVEVETGVETRARIEIRKGISPGDTVTTVGGYGLPDGCPVQIIAGPKAAECGK